MIANYKAGEANVHLKIARPGTSTCVVWKSKDEKKKLLIHKFADGWGFFNSTFGLPPSTIYYSYIEIMTYLN
jgi:hypothetical protein